jgi:GxxExxY protein
MVKHSEVTRKAIGAFLNVYNALGSGCLEKVYQNSMIVELTRFGLSVSSQTPVHVYYRGVYVGEYIPDIIVEDCVILELKSCKELADEHRAQLLNYLKASRFEVGLLMNFGPEPKFERFAFDNVNKGSLSWISAVNVTE